MYCRYIFLGAQICRKSLFYKEATAYGICPPFSLWNNVILKRNLALTDYSFLVSDALRSDDASIFTLYTPI